MQSIKHSMSFTLPMKLTKDNGWYISCCPILNVYSQGQSEKEAEKNLIEALVLFFESCIERGTLTQVMQEAGFQVEREVSVKVQRQKKSSTKYIDVPIHLVAPKNHESLCHA